MSEVDVSEWEIGVSGALLLINQEASPIFLGPHLAVIFFFSFFGQIRPCFLVPISVGGRPWC